MKDCTTCKYGFVDEQLGFPMCHHPSRFSEDCVDFNMHEEIEEPEKATGIEEKKLPDGLEEAKEAYCNEHNDDCFDAIGDTCPHIRKAFIAGAEWQKEQDLAEMAQSKSPLSVAYANRCFENGKQAMKEEMMKEAVEGKIIFLLNGDMAINIGDTDKYKLGDKVRIIVIPNTDEK